MESEEYEDEHRGVYNAILATVTILGLACGLWMHCSAPSAPSVHLSSMSASYKLKTSNTPRYPQHEKYDDTVFAMNITVRNEDSRWEARLGFLDVWVYARKKWFMRTKLAQELVAEELVLQPLEKKVVEVKLRQDRGLKVAEWKELIVSVFFTAQFPGTTDLLGRPREAQRTRDCADISATIHKATSTAVVEDKLPKKCNAPY